jgi:phage baseplate assembly protein W
MIPVSTRFTEPLVEVDIPSKTYKIFVDGLNEDNDQIGGYIDDLDAVKQAIYLILNTEKYEFPIYSWDYGIELIDLYGKPIPYVISELERRVTEALTQDDRISEVVNFEYDKEGHRLHVKFNVITDFGSIDSEMEVDV